MPAADSLGRQHLLSDKYRERHLLNKNPSGGV